MRINISIWFGSLSIILSLAGCSTASRLSISTPQENASPGITATMSSVTPEPASSPTHQPPATVESSPTVQPMASYIFLPYGSGGTRAWQVKDKQVSEITLPDMLMNSYDSAPSSGKVLYPSHFPDVGAGPANLSAGDLSPFQSPATLNCRCTRCPPPASNDGCAMRVGSSLTAGSP